MASIENKEDWNSYSPVLEDLWDAATIRLSLVDVEQHRIPNGEIIFHREPHDGNTTLYSVSDFAIYEETVSNPYDIVDKLFDDTLEVDGTALDLEFRHLKNTNEFFQRGGGQTRVHESRPVYGELQTIFKPDLSEELEEAHRQAVNEVDERLKTADEPYFDLAKCEYYYFDQHFRGKSAADPMILVLADTGIRFSIDDENEMQLQFPVELAEDITILVYPIRPYGKFKGWKIPMDSADFDEDDNGLATYVDTLDIEGMEMLYFRVYVGDKVMGHERHYNPDIESDNPRFRIYEQYDQKRDLLKYLQGEKDPDQFEIAVLNVLSLAGYIVQWFGEDSFSIPNYSNQTQEPEKDEIDIVAYAPDGSHIAFVECTNQRISDKTSILDRMEDITSEIIGQGEVQFDPDPQWGTDTIPCIATPQSPSELSNEVIDELENMGIVVLDSETLVAIYEASAEQDDLLPVSESPGFWGRRE